MSKKNNKKESTFYSHDECLKASSLLDSLNDQTKCWIINIVLNHHMKDFMDRVLNGGVRDDLHSN